MSTLETELGRREALPNYFTLARLPGLEKLKPAFQQLFIAMIAHETLRHEGHFGLNNLVIDSTGSMNFESAHNGETCMGGTLEIVMTALERMMQLVSRETKLQAGVLPEEQKETFRRDLEAKMQRLDREFPLVCGAAAEIAYKDRANRLNPPPFTQYDIKPIDPPLIDNAIRILEMWDGSETESSASGQALPNVGEMTYLPALKIVTDDVRRAFLQLVLVESEKAAKIEAIERDQRDARIACPDVMEVAAIDDDKIALTFNQSYDPDHGYIAIYSADLIQQGVARAVAIVTENKVELSRQAVARNREFQYLDPNKSALLISKLKSWFAHIAADIR
jgi:hypothetical protein